MLKRIGSAISERTNPYNHDKSPRSPSYNLSEKEVYNIAMKSLPEREPPEPPEIRENILKRSFSCTSSWFLRTNPYSEDFKRLIEDIIIDIEKEDAEVEILEEKGKEKENGEIENRQPIPNKKQIIINYIDHKKTKEIEALIAQKKWNVIYELLISLFSQENNDVKKLIRFLFNKMESKQMFKFIQFLIKHEISREKEATLFREDSVTTLVVSAWFAHLLIPQFKSSLRKIIRSVPKGRFELDIVRAKNQEKVNLSIKKIKEVFPNILGEMIKIATSKKVPNQIRKINSFTYENIAHHFNERLANKFKNQWFILRFFNPFLCLPWKYGFRQHYANLDNGAAMISKLMQALANNVRFGENEKYMTPFNDFLFKTNNDQKSLKKKFNEAIKNLYLPGFDLKSETDSNSNSVSSEYLTDIGGDLEGIRSEDFEEKVQLYFEEEGESNLASSRQDSYGYETDIDKKLTLESI